MMMLQELITDFKRAWELGSEPRDPWYFYSRRFITAQECLLLERYPENA